MFECCIPVKGASRSIVCDVQRNTYLQVPNTMADFIEKYDGKQLAVIAADFSEPQLEILEKYIDFLLTNELAFLTGNPDYYPKISTHFETPHLISNAIIDQDASSRHDYNALISQLDHLGCQALEFRFFEVVSFDFLRELMGLCKLASFRSVELIIRFEDKMLRCLEDYQQLVEDHNQLHYIVIHSAPEDLDLIPEKLLFTSQKIQTESCCGNINLSGFNPNQTLFFESMNFNNCLNKKISVDKHGIIKNCPSMENGFGKATEVKLSDVLKTDTFKALWGITKDQINICKDCEFRYICVDCRAYKQERGNIYAKPLKCKYDPYSGVWSQ